MSLHGKHGKRNIMSDSAMKFFKGVRVLVTGHTGFKGSWLSLWLKMLGAEVYGYALPPPTSPSLYEDSRLDNIIHSTIADITDYTSLYKEFRKTEPEVVFHLAAQPLVRESYREPKKTYETNVLGTVNILEAIRETGSVKVFVNVTTDKCYDNREWYWPYRENEPLGGRDPYSSSKACSELVTAAYRESFFSHNQSTESISIASARAGNVIGGGDWGEDRLMPDCCRAILTNTTILLRAPEAVRPWQHVLEPLHGYLRLASKMYENRTKYSGAWNFGPDEIDMKTVKWVVDHFCALQGLKDCVQLDTKPGPHEAKFLKLDSSKARFELGWKPCWSVEMAIEKLVEWLNAYRRQTNIREMCERQIVEYSELIRP